MRLLDEAELATIEGANPAGLTSQRIVEIFQDRGIRLSEATFRKYVQMGLLPRSVRVGMKGKHRGSQGMYPVGTVRQINEIKRMMSLDYTIEDIQRRFVLVRGEIAELARRIEELLGRIEGAIASGPLAIQTARSLTRELGEARRQAVQLIGQLQHIEGSLGAEVEARKVAV
ncbi:MAG: hypothetical protein HYY06_06630 [Deltaproteobacteria bacterium]|nr:hypothetical protein [Deltaproteobacteria bacterium]